MIKQLAKLGATQHIQVIPDYDDKGNVTVTILFKPKDKEAELMPPHQLSGTIEEVETYLANEYEATTEKVEKLRTNLLEVQAEMEKQAKDKKPSPPAKKSEPAKPAAKAKPEKPVVEEPAEKTTKIEAAKLPGLEPAWKKKAAAAAAPAPAEVPALNPDELAEMFKDTDYKEGSTS